MELLKFHGIPWNFSTGYSDSMEFHGIWLCNQIPWTLFNSMEFHGMWCWHHVPWNFQSSMEFHGTSRLTWKSSMEFHGSPWNFWRVPWNCEILILINFIIGGVKFTVCCMISCYYISDNPLVVEILRYFNSKATFGAHHFAQKAILDSKLRPVIFIVHLFTHGLLQSSTSHGIGYLRYINQTLNVRAYFIRDCQYHEILVCPHHISSKLNKPMFPGLWGPVGGPCNSENTNGYQK